jgi:hypothetical protein
MMSSNVIFPLELLNRSIAEKLAYFESFTVAHPKLREVLFMVPVVWAKRLYASDWNKNY